MTRVQRNSTILLLILVSIVGATGIAGDSRYALDRNCEPEDFVSELRAAFQGRAYWVAQLKFLDDSVAATAKSLANLIEKTSKVDTVSEEAEKALRQPFPELERINQMYEGMYVKYPELRPSPAQVEADRLRARATALEATDFQARIQKMMVDVVSQRLARTTACRPLVEEKVQR